MKNSDKWMILQLPQNKGLTACLNKYQQHDSDKQRHKVHIFNCLVVRLFTYRMCPGHGLMGRNAIES